MTAKELCDIIDKAYAESGVHAMSTIIEEVRENNPELYKEYQEYMDAEDKRMSEKYGIPTVKEMLDEIFPTEEALQQYRAKWDSGEIEKIVKEGKAEIAKWREEHKDILDSVKH